MKLTLVLFLCLAAMARAQDVTWSTGDNNESRALEKAVTAASGSPADVQTAINAATDGGTVVIPNGSYRWASGVTLTKFLTLTAQSLGGVTITHDFPAGNLITWKTAAAGHSTIAGIHFLAGSGNNGAQYIDLSPGTNGQFAILHDCTFQMTWFWMHRAVDWRATGGLIYNCTVDASKTDAQQFGPGTDSNAIRFISYYPWYNASTWGTQDTNGINTYVENCTFVNSTVCLDVDDCARLVIRHCTFDNSGGLNHGITSLWGGRQVEMYDNDFKYHKVPPSSQNMVWVNLLRYWWFRAGTGRIWGNRVQAIYSGHFWNATSSWVMTDEPLTRPGSGNPQAEYNVDYPGTRWAGTGSNGTDKRPPSQSSPGKVSPSFVDPIYIWDNISVPSEISGGNSNAGSWWATDDQRGYGHDPVAGVNRTADVFLLNRDIILSAPASYAPYPYPHPLASGGGGGPLPTPTPTPQPTPTPTPQPTPTPAPTPTPTPNPTPAPGQTYSNWLNQLSSWIQQHPALPDK